MAAVAYKVTAQFALGSPGGPRKSISMTASDVAAASWLTASLSGVNVIHGSQDAYLIDAILSAAGTDTTQSEFFLNGISTGFLLQNATSLGSTNGGRPFQQAPLKIPAGSQLAVIQRA